MVCLTHTPIYETELCSIFNLPKSVYDQFVGEGIISLSYSDYHDPNRRFKAHNSWDLIHFSFVLTLGWPIRSIEQVQEEANEFCDILALITDEYTPFFKFSPMKFDEILLIINSLEIFQNKENSWNVYLSPTRKKCVKEFLLRIAELIQKIDCQDSQNNASEELRGGNRAAGISGRSGMIYGITDQINASALRGQKSTQTSTPLSVI